MSKPVQVIDPSDEYITRRAYAMHAETQVIAARATNVVANGSDSEYFHYLAMCRRAEALLDAWIDCDREAA